jgi:O-succinylhomoserine sulfhydrylase
MIRTGCDFRGRFFLLCGDRQMSDETRDWKPATTLVHGGTRRSGFGETSEAIFLTQGFVYDSAEAAEARFKGEDPGFIYSRYANPTVDMFEKRMCLLEGAEDARATASGMAAVSAALLCSVKAGDHVVAARALFGSCRWVVEKLLPQYGVETTLVDGTKMEEWEKAVRPNTKLFFLESPTNPTLEVIDIAAVAALANSIGARVVVDNVFATPLCRSRWNSAPTSSSIPRPSTLTGRAAAWAASSCPTRSGSTPICTTTTATPARRCRPSTPGRC